MAITLYFCAGREFTIQISHQEIQTHDVGNVLRQEFQHIGVTRVQQESIYDFAQQIVAYFEESRYAQEREDLLRRYYANRRAKIGDTMYCAGCGEALLKTTRRKQFCSTRGHQNCKNRFWNTIKELPKDGESTVPNF